MVAPRKKSIGKSSPAWHATFVSWLPLIRRRAAIAFRHLRAEAREEAVEEVICNACVAFARLIELGKADVAYPGPLAMFGIRQVKDGRKTGCSLNIRDVLHPYCQRKKNLAVERLDRFDTDENAWQEVLIADQHATPADMATIRIDFAAWLKTLGRRERKIAQTLATGETTGSVAKQFKVSAGRISQMRREFADSWQRFQGAAA